MTPYSYRRGTLYVEDVPLPEVAAAYGTPAYVYSGNRIRQACRAIEESLGTVSHLTCYAVKANANREILRMIAEEGLGADVGSGGELELALQAGFPSEKITFSGVGKRDDEIRAALLHEIHAFNVESEQECEVISQLAASLGKRARILARVNLDLDAGGHAYVSTSRSQNKFGIPRQRVAEVLLWARTLPGLELGGIHSHIGSQITRREVLLRGAHLLAELVADLRSRGLRIEELDFGGGFGIRYRGAITHPDLPKEEPELLEESPASMIREVVPVLSATGCRLSLQPGRAIVGEAGLLLVRVLYRKQTEEKTFIIVDGGMNDLIRPSLYHAHHQIVPVLLDDRPHEMVDVVGPVCESGDFFAQDRPLPASHRGDYLALMCAGAYGFVLSSTYNARPRVPEILIEGATHRQIRSREGLDDL
jgi:diaminopimelate decarboxylase